MFSKRFFELIRSLKVTIIIIYCALYSVALLQLVLASLNLRRKVLFDLSEIFIQAPNCITWTGKAASPTLMSVRGRHWSGWTTQPLWVSLQAWTGLACIILFPCLYTPDSKISTQSHNLKLDELKKPPTTKAWKTLNSQYPKNTYLPLPFAIL